MGVLERTVYKAEIGLGQSEHDTNINHYMAKFRYTQIYKSVGVNKKYKLTEGQNKLIEEPYEKVQLYK